MCVCVCVCVCVPSYAHLPQDALVGQLKELLFINVAGSIELGNCEHKDL